MPSLVNTAFVALTSLSVVSALTTDTCTNGRKRAYSFTTTCFQETCGTIGVASGTSLPANSLDSCFELCAQRDIPFGCVYASGECTALSAAPTSGSSINAAILNVVPCSVSTSSTTSSTTTTTTVAPTTTSQTTSTTSRTSSTTTSLSIPQCTNGPRSVKGRTCTVTCGIDRLGGDIPGQAPLNVDTFEGCIQACAGLPGCVSAQYHELTKYCYFKNARNPTNVDSTKDTVDCDPPTGTSTTSTTSTTAIRSRTTTSSVKPSTSTYTLTTSNKKATWTAWETSKQTIKSTKTAQSWSDWQSQKMQTTSSKSNKPVVTTAVWNQWEGAPVTVTLTKTFYVPCSTGWQTKTTVVYSGYCGCKETPKPTTVRMTTVTSTLTMWDTKTVVVVTLPATPTPDAGQSWNSWVSQSPAPTMGHATGSDWSSWTASPAQTPSATSGSQSWSSWNGNAPVQTGTVKAYTGEAGKVQLAGLTMLIEFMGLLLL